MSDLDAICLGEALIDFVSTEPVASVAEAPAFVPAPGGSPANCAVALARLGVKTGFVGKVGDDPFGHLLASTLARNGVDVGNLAFDAEARTALAFVALDAVGRPDYVFFRHPSADMRLRPDELDAGYLSSARVFHTGSIILSAEPSRSTAIAALRIASEAGLLVSLDPNVRMSLWSSPEELRRVMLPLLPLTDVVKLSEEDLSPLVGTSDPTEGCARLRERGARLVVVTRGEDGCFCQNALGSQLVPGWQVDVVDTTGAGDAFMGGLLAGLLAIGATSGRPETISPSSLLPVLRLANGVGALTTTVRGAIPALPTGDQVRAFLEAKGEHEASWLLQWVRPAAAWNRAD